eukprot:m.60382 g.60382  ORF g.60382 m.60382 type:complete len:97 (-) comp11812_c0_seq3:1686-1976(-)
MNAELLRVVVVVALLYGVTATVSNPTPSEPALEVHDNKIYIHGEDVQFIRDGQWSSLAEEFNASDAAQTELRGDSSIARVVSFKGYRARALYVQET